MMNAEEYFAKPHTKAQRAAAVDLIKRRNALRAEYYAATGRTGPDIDPDTGTEISGKKGGTGGGGFRLDGEEGSANSSHKIKDPRRGAGVDDYDPHNDFDDWISLFDRDDGRLNEKLETYGLYREAPEYTDSWVHLSTRPPASGKRTFIP